MRRVKLTRMATETSGTVTRTHCRTPAEWTACTAAAVVKSLAECRDAQNRKKDQYRTIAILIRKNCSRMIHRIYARIAFFWMPIWHTGRNAIFHARIAKLSDAPGADCVIWSDSAAAISRARVQNFWHTPGQVASDRFMGIWPSYWTKSPICSDHRIFPQLWVAQMGWQSRLYKTGDLTNKQTDILVQLLDMCLKWRCLSCQDWKTGRNDCSTYYIRA